MKTIRIKTTSKTDSVKDVEKFFAKKEESQLKAVDELTDNDFQAKIKDCHLHFIDDTTIDMLVPDSFNASSLDGTIIASDGVNFLHEWLGHSSTPMIISKDGTTKISIKDKEITEGTK